MPLDLFNFLKVHGYIVCFILILECTILYVSKRVMPPQSVNEYKISLMDNISRVFYFIMVM